MKYVLTHAALTALTLVCALMVSWLVFTNIADTTAYGVALLALMIVALVWIPFGITLNETVGEYKAFQRRRRRLAAAKRRHPSRRR